MLTAPPPASVGGDHDSGRPRLGLTGIGNSTHTAAAGPGEGGGVWEVVYSCVDYGGRHSARLGGEVDEAA